MPITIYTGANLKKLKKAELLSHVVELYGFIDVFDQKKIMDENEELKEEKRLYLEGLNLTHEENKFYWESMGKMREEIKKLKEDNVKLKKKISLGKYNRDDDKVMMKAYEEEIKELKKEIEELKESQ